MVNGINDYEFQNNCVEFLIDKTIEESSKQVTAGAHRALIDCWMNQKVFEHLKLEMENPSDAAKAVKKCPHCGNILKLRSGKFGDFWGCSSYPDCKYTMNK